MNLISTANNVLLESVNIPALEKLISTATADISGLTVEEIAALAKVLPRKLMPFRHQDAVAAIDAILLHPTTGFKPKKSKAETVVDDQIHELVK
tara:strand:- start:10629 stop:10910 length:282 start_codon:yes stop_codon:yes gene_type:complete